jgi:hypothetical protein
VRFIELAKSPRRYIPAMVVALTLAISYMAPLPADASKINNCGVKAGYGYAFHDHGKPCPNRPFPGKGVGLAKFGINVTAGSAGATTSVGHGKKSSVAKVDASAVDTDNDSTTGNASSGKVHGKGHGRGHSKI